MASLSSDRLNSDRKQMVSDYNTRTRGGKGNSKFYCKPKRKILLGIQFEILTRLIGDLGKNVDETNKGNCTEKKRPLTFVMMGLGNFHS